MQHMSDTKIQIHYIIHVANQVKTLLFYANIGFTVRVRQK